MEIKMGKMNQINHIQSCSIIREFTNCLGSDESIMRNHKCHDVICCITQDMLYQCSMPINTDQCRITFLALTPMSINKYQCRSKKINIGQYLSILLNFI